MIEITLIPLSDIAVQDRARPPSNKDVQTMAADIADRGLRNAIEVARHPEQDGYLLVSGGHRLEAYKELGRTEIECVIIEGTAEELRRDELLENLARRELSALEEAQFLAELKTLHIKITGARNGGDRKSKRFQKSVVQDEQLISWYATAGEIRERSADTIRRSATLGEKLCPDAANLLRGTDFESNQSQLIALSKEPREAQAAIAQMLTSGDHKTVKSATDHISGKPPLKKAHDMTAEELWIADFKKHWVKAPTHAARTMALNWLNGLGEIAHLCGTVASNTPNNSNVPETQEAAE